MTANPRVPLAIAAVALVILVDVVATVLVDHEAQVALIFCCFAAVATAIHTVARNLDSLSWMLVLSLPPVISLLLADSPTWLMGPLGALLFAACELAVLSWEFRGVAPDDALARRRAVNIAQLASLGLAASIVVSLASLAPSPGGTTAIVVATIALAGLARITFARRT